MISLHALNHSGASLATDKQLEIFIKFHESETCFAAINDHG